MYLANLPAKPKIKLIKTILTKVKYGSGISCIKLRFINITYVTIFKVI